MRHTNSPIEFAQELYTLSTQMDYVTAQLQLWLSYEGRTAQFGDRLARSSLAQRIVCDLKCLLLELADELEEYLDEDQLSSTQGLYSIAKRSLELKAPSRKQDCHDSDFYRQELKYLELGARIATKMVGDLFEHFFLSLTWISTARIPSDTIEALQLLEIELDRLMDSLGEILHDLGDK